MSDVMIEARNLTKSYGSVFAIKDVNFEVRRGEVLGFLGPNGAGKTTTMKILTCFISPTSGSARVNGCDVFEDSLGVRSALGYLPEHTPLYTDMMVVEYLEFIAAMRGFQGKEAKRRVKNAVDATTLGDVIGKEIRALSKGYRQRVGLAQALIHEPPILILDEPLSGLDPNQAAEIRDLIRHLGREKTVILSTHDLGEIQRTCDRVLIINEGTIVADDAPEALQRNQSARVEAIIAVTGSRGGDKASVTSAASTAFSKLEGVKHLKSFERGDELVFDIEAAESEDLRPKIFRAAVEHDLLLVGLRITSRDLGAVFKDLTVGSSSSASREKSGKRAQEVNLANDKTSRESEETSEEGGQ